MTSKRITQNHREGLSVADSITGNQFYLKGNSSDGSLNVNITSGGAGGTQYAEGTTTSPATGTVALGRYSTSPPTLTNGQLNAPQLDVNGNLKVTIASGGGSGGTSSSFGSAFPSTGTAIGISNGTNMVAITQGQTTMSASIPVTIASNQSALPVTLTSTTITGTVAVTQSGTWNITNISGTVSLPTGASTEATLAKLTQTQGSTTTGQSGPLTQGAVTTAAPAYTTAQTSPLSLTTAGALRIDGSGATQPISGTVTANAGTGNFTVVQPTAASLNATIVGTGTLAVQLTGATNNINNISGTISLPTGAATAANQATEISSLATIATNTVQIPSVVSTNNSSTAALTSGSVFTGTSDDCINYSEMRVTVFADVASATDGLSLQQSENNSNWDVTDTYTMPAMSAGQGKTFVVPRQARYFRVVYTNGGTNQTTFRLQTILNRTGTAPSSNRASDGYTNETDLVQNQTFSMVYNGSTWDRLRTVTAQNDSVAGTGMMASGIWGYNGASFERVRVDLGDGSAATGLLVNNSLLYNGTTYDRQRSAPGVTGASAIGGFTASGSSLAVAPITTGSLAKTANPTAVADGQVVNSLADKLGKQVVVGSIRDLKADAALTLTSSTSETTLIAAIASTFNDLYGLIVVNISATACEVVFRDVTAGTPRFSIYVPAGETRGFMLGESAAYKQATVNTAWTAQAGTSVASIKISALYVKNI